MLDQSTKKESAQIFLTSLHHSDLTWQFPYEGYDEIREEQTNIVLGFFKRHPEFQFIFDQAYIVKNYLKRNPDKQNVLKELIAKGKIELIGLNCIPDLNMASGESFIRNSLMGRQYYKKNFGIETNIASLMDAFGMPAQIPQLLCKLGYKYLLPGRMPNADPKLNLDKPFNWQSPDGSFISVIPQNGGVDKSSYAFNVPVALNAAERFEETLEHLAHTTGDIFALYCTEIEMFDEQVFDIIDKVNSKKEDGKRKITFGRYSDYCNLVDVLNLPATAGEFNPTFTGCYTTRIGVKQAIRRAENILFAAELSTALAGSSPSFDEIWEELNLAQFHDAACGCHHDAPHTDVMNKLVFVQKQAISIYENALSRLSDNRLTVLNPTRTSKNQLIATDVSHLPIGIPAQRDGEQFVFEAALPCFGVKRFDYGAAPENHVRILENPGNYRLQTDYFTVDFSDAFPKIASRQNVKNIYGQENFGEVLFRHENGSMWSERLMQPYFGREHQSEQVIRVEEGPVFIKIVTKGKVIPGCTPASGNIGDYWTGFEDLSFTKEYIFPLHLDYFKLRLSVSFHGCNTKISLRVPVELDPDKAVARYDTPFASMERKPYFEVPYRYRNTRQELNPGDYQHAAGDWPALQWVDYADPDIGLAVANIGTPGHNIVGSNIFISLLRSGTRCQDGSMYPQPGSFDNGEHTFEFAFCDHAADRPETASLLGELLNHQPVACTRQSPASGQAVTLPDNGSLFYNRKDNVVVSAIYPDDRDIVVRAYECFGKAVSDQFEIPNAYQLFSADFQGIAKDELNPKDVNFEPYEIRTFRLVQK